MEIAGMFHQNTSSLRETLAEYLAINNLSYLLMDYTDEELSSILREAGEKTQNPRLVSIDEQELIKFREYQAHKFIALYVPPFVLLLGLFGNVLSFFILRHKTMTRLSTNTFLAALSVADSLVLFIGLFRRWIGEVTGLDLQHHSKWLCKTINVFGYSTSQYSVWLIVGVTVERYIVVCHPLRASRFCNIQRARKVVILLALIFLLLNSHLFWTVDVRQEEFEGRIQNRCDGLKEYKILVESIWPWVDALLYSVAPIIVIILFNVVIIRQVIQATYGRDVLQNGSLMKSESRRSSSKDSNAKLTIMLLTISFTFLATTLPICIVMIVTLVWNEETKSAETLAKLWLIRTIAELLMYMNHSINFFLYCATGQKFRNIVLRILCRRSVSNISNVSDHSQHLYCSRTNVPNGGGCSPKLDEETTV